MKSILLSGLVVLSTVAGAQAWELIQEPAHQERQSYLASRPIGAGTASWYGPGFHGRKTASGQRFNQNAMTAAHRTLPFGTRVRVTNHGTGRSVVVTINDRGPFHGGRVIDLSKASAAAIGMGGTARVTLERVS